MRKIIAFLKTHNHYIKGLVITIWGIGIISLAPSLCEYIAPPEYYKPTLALLVGYGAVLALLGFIVSLFYGIKDR